MVHVRAKAYKGSCHNLCFKLQQTFTAGRSGHYSMLILCGCHLMPVISTLFFPTPEQNAKNIDIKKKDHGELAHKFENGWYTVVPRVRSSGRDLRRRN